LPIKKIRIVLKNYYWFINMSKLNRGKHYEDVVQNNYYYNEKFNPDEFTSFTFKLNVFL